MLIFILTNADIERSLRRSYTEIQYYRLYACNYIRNSGSYFPYTCVTCFFSSIDGIERWEHLFGILSSSVLPCVRRYQYIFPQVLRTVARDCDYLQTSMCTPFSKWNVETSVCLNYINNVIRFNLLLPIYLWMVWINFVIQNITKYIYLPIYQKINNFYQYILSL